MITKEQFDNYGTTSDRIDALFAEIRKIQDQDQIPVHKFIRDNAGVVREYGGIHSSRQIDDIEWDEGSECIDVYFKNGESVFLDWSFFREFQTYQDVYSETINAAQRKINQALEETERKELARLKAKYES